MKTLKFFFFAVLALSSLIATAQITDRIITESSIVGGKYSREQVWDAQRSPAYPSAGRDWTLSGLKAPLDISSRSTIDWGLYNDRYLMFELVEDRTNNPASLIDYESRNKYSIALKLFDRSGRFVKTVSRWGKLIGFGSEGFMYEQEGQAGTFFSAVRTRPGGLVIYHIEIAQVDNLMQILRDSRNNNYRGNDRPNDQFRVNDKVNNDRINNDRLNNRGNDNFRGNDRMNITRSVFFNAKFTFGKVWDAQRFPVYPFAGRDWRLSNLKLPFDISTNGTIDWGRHNDRYLMFDLEDDHSVFDASLVDDIYNTRTRYNISLKLFERDGQFVKTISKWGKLIGFGPRGFMYEQQGQLGTYFATDIQRLGGGVTYRPELDQVRNLSALMK